MTTKAYTIFHDDLDALQMKLAQCNRKADRLGCPRVTLTLGHYSTMERDHQVYELIEVTLTGSAPSVSGWTLVSRIDHAEGGVIFNAPGQTTPTQYRDKAPVCDHCGKERTRNVTYILVKDGAYKQVGANCLGDFLGGTDPHKYAALFEWYTDLDHMVREFSDPADEDSFGGAGRTANGFSLKHFLAYTALEIRLGGWVSRGKAAEDFTGRTQATADCALFRMSDKYNKTLPTDADRATAEATADWMKKLGDRGNLNDYLHNLWRIGESGYVTGKLAGYAGSAIAAMEREQAQAQAEKDAAKTLAFIGKVGERTELTLTLLDVRTIDGGRFTSYLHKFVDQTGNKVDWFASAGGLTEGATYRGKATIKNHEVYHGIPTTYITRAKLELAA